MDDVRKRVGEVLTDYRDGLLDSLDDAIDEVLAALRGSVEVTTMADREPRFIPIAPLKHDRDADS